MFSLSLYDQPYKIAENRKYTEWLQNDFEHNIV